ncbi:hypothetical protein ACLB2K_012155 [Fragaria x ananassa]
MATKQAMVAKEFNPDLQGVDHFILAYQIHNTVSEKKDRYHVLGFQQKGLSSMHVKAAWDFLSDPAKKKAYDKSLRSSQLQGSNVKNTRKRACPKGKTATTGDDLG